MERLDKMKRRFPILAVLIVLLTVVLAACGDSTVTSPSMGQMEMTKPAATVAAGATSKPAATTDASMGSMTTKPAGAVADNMGSDPMTDSLKGMSGMDFELNFMQMMIVHHQSAIDMAKLIPTNTKRPELIKLGQDIIAAQSKEIGDMTSWLAKWNNAKPLADSMSVPGMMTMMSDMDKLKTAKDENFDKQFLTMMIAHHQQAVNMANLVATKTQRPELNTLAQAIIKAQTMEIDQMTGWQKAWFKA